MEAIVALGKYAVLCDPTMEKIAGGWSDTAKSVLLPRLKQLFTKSVAGGLRKFAPGRALATAIGGTEAALGAKDLFQGATGGWDSQSQGNLAWHKQGIRGEDLNASAHGTFSPTAWGRTLASPVKSIASQFAGDGPTQVPGSQPTASLGAFDPATGSYKVDAPSHVQPIWSPRVEGKNSMFEQLSGQKGKMDEAQLQHLNSLRSDLRSGNYSEVPKDWKPAEGPEPASRGWRTPPPTEAALRQVQTDRVKHNEQMYDTGAHGNNPGFLGFGKTPSSAQLGEQITPLEAELRRIGRLAAKKTPTPPMPGTATVGKDPSRAEGPGSDWRFGLVTPADEEENK
jgi:hypothetical protein